MKIGMVRRWVALWCLLCASTCNRLENFFVRMQLKLLHIQPTRVVWLTPEQYAQLVQGENPFEGGELPDTSPKVN